MTLVPIYNIKRDPQKNWEIDPSRNWRINPVKNWEIDPSRNWEIDPVRNWQINPNRNWQINPGQNWQINPKQNWEINPEQNWQINPNQNSIIDPFRSNEISGYYVCSVENNGCGFFTVNTNKQNTMLVFNSNREFCYFAVSFLNLYLVFSSTDLSYKGTMIPNDLGGYNWFLENGSWSFFLT